jgi:peptide/nickel transport system ATP-binding protein
LTFPGEAAAGGPSLLELQDVDLAYGSEGIPLPYLRRELRPVVHHFAFHMEAGETFALVGESGSGKTTIARAVAGLLAPISGQILFEGQDISTTVGRRPKESQRQIQFVFQNPDASLNPRRRISYSVGRPLDFFFGLSGSAKKDRIEQLLNDVDLDASYQKRLPSQLSGGERQRVAIARAMAAEPKLMLCDEIVSALDVSVQANILDLLQRLQAERGIAYLFIAHDLAVVRWLAHRVGVMYLGWMLETGSAEDVFSPPFHPYTEMLMQSVPEPDPDRPCPAVGQSQTIIHYSENTEGCAFAARCEYKARDECDAGNPPWHQVTPTHAIRCHLPPSELATLQASLTEHAAL